MERGRNTDKKKWREEERSEGKIPPNAFSTNTWLARSFVPSFAYLLFPFLSSLTSCEGQVGGAAAATGEEEEEVEEGERDS